MFARVLEMRTKRGQARALCAVVDQKALPVVEKYPGFAQGICLISEETPDSVMVISLWQNREAAEKFRIEDYPAVAEMYQPFIDGGIHVRGYDVPFMSAQKPKAQAAKAS
jgi:heme-degrading monooxygenase HmoA